jgi:aspartyl-tRNA(Asn)/glutamyl-tRNA(Gln) amidotransferase subunit C
MSGNFDIQEIAKLASIELNKDELKRLRKELEVILEHVKALSNIKLGDSDITIHPLGIDLTLREDNVEEGLSHDESISNAPDRKGGYFKVPPSME